MIDYKSKAFIERIKNYHKNCPEKEECTVFLQFDIGLISVEPILFYCIANDIFVWKGYNEDGYIFGFKNNSDAVLLKLYYAGTDKEGKCFHM